MGFPTAVRSALVDGNEGPKLPPAAAAKPWRNFHRQEPKGSVQMSHQGCSQTCWGTSGDRTWHAELGGGSFGGCAS